MAADSSQLQRFADALRGQRFRRARALAGWQAGVRSSVDLIRLHARDRELSTPEPFEAAREALGGATQGEQPRLRRLALALAEAFAHAQSAKAQTQLLAKMPRARVSVELEQLALPDALRELPVCGDRARRAQLAGAVDMAMRELAPLMAERAEQELSALRKLGADVLREPIADLANEAEKILRQTSDAAQDLLEFRLRRAGLGGLGGPRRDLELALELRDLRESLSPHRAPELAAQLARGLGFDPSAGGRISVDAEPRLGRFPGLQVAQLGPDALAVVSVALESPADLERLARGVGAAIHLAGVSDDLDEIDRFMLDSALPGASGWILAQPLGDPAWGRRILRLPARPAGELAQAFALRGLFQLRSSAARLLAAIDLEAQGPSAASADRFRSRMSAATFVDAGEQGAFDLDVASAGAELRALLLAERLSYVLVENFDRDWWRNPRSQELLRAFSSGGGAIDLDALLGAAPSVETRVRRFIERAAR